VVAGDRRRIQHQDAIGAARGFEPVRDSDDGPAALSECSLGLEFGARV
jgi:hypothetical protein